MKKKTRNLMVALMLLVSVLAQNILAPLRVEAAERMVIGEVVNDAKLREGPGKDYEVVKNLEKETLIYIIGSTTNRYGNVWFEVSVLGETKYLVSSSVKEHKHSYDIAISNENTMETCFACRCGSVECNPQGIQQTFFGFAGAVAATGLTTSEAAALVGLIGGYAVYKSKLGYVIPVVINEAGALVSKTATEFAQEIDELKKKHKNDDNDSSSKKIYYEAFTIKRDKDLKEDTLQLVNYKKPLDIEQACCHLDRILAVKKAFGSYKAYVKDERVEIACNMYTLEQDDALALCKKLCACSQNPINQYGKSDKSEGCERNSLSKLNGTYYHYHLFNKFDKKSVVHVLFGSPLYANTISTLKPSCN